MSLRARPLNKNITARIRRITTDDGLVSKLSVIIVVILGLSFVNIFCISKVSAFLQQQQQPMQDVLAQQNIVPQAKLIYNNQYYDMSPFVFANNRQLNKIQFPSSAGSFDNGLTLQKGSPISFQFSKQPLRVDAFVADYESDVPELFVLKKIGSNTFELSGPTGLYNIEVHAIFIDGQYTSHTVLASIIDNGPASGSQSTQSTQTGLTQGNSAANLNNNNVRPEQVCNRRIKLDPLGQDVLSNPVNNINLQANSLGNALIPRTWSTEGIDILSFAAAVTTTTTTDMAKTYVDAFANKNPWVRLDLGSNNLICNIGITFGNADNSVNYFTVQTSTDGINFKNLGVVETSPISASGQALYNFPGLPDMTRYVRIANLGSIPVGSVSIAELSALGS